MNELELIIAAIAIVLLLIIILIFFIARKGNSIKGDKTPAPAKQAEANKLAEKPILDIVPKKIPLTEPQAKEPLHAAESDIKPIAEPKTNTTIPLAQIDSFKNLPQDSMLRRHYLTNLRAMIESLNPPRPTDSALRRHYDSIISAEIEQCFSDQGSIERLIHDYENHKKTLVQQIQEPITIAEPLLKTEPTRTDSAAQQENLKVPEDSMLRRHFMTNLYVIVESGMSPRPTDSVLRRHYDTMLNDEVNKLLNSKTV